jgi:hypothetical protein
VRELDVVDLSAQKVNDQDFYSIVLIILGVESEVSGGDLLRTW